MQNQPQDERLGLPSASGFLRLISCPGSFAAERDVNVAQEDEAPECQEGSIIHKSLETGDYSQLSEDQLQIAKRLNQLLNDGIDAWHSEFGLDRSKTLVDKECRLWLHDGTTPVASAQLDRLLICDQNALVCDFKTGYIDATPAFTNAQLKLQAAVVKANYENVKHIRVAIDQARFKSKFDFCDYSEKDLAMARHEIDIAIWRSKQTGAQRSAGDHCRHCRARGVCREATGYALVPVAQSGLTLDAKVGKKEIVERVSQLSLPELAQIASRASIAVNVIEAAKDRLKQFTSEELATVGYELADGGSTRSIEDTQKLFDTLWSEGLLGKDVDQAVTEFRSFTTVKLGELEKALEPRLKEARKLKTAKDAKKLLGEIIAPVTTLTPKAKQLKPIKE